jgi:hypothetical protein
LALVPAPAVVVALAGCPGFKNGGTTDTPDSAGADAAPSDGDLGPSPFAIVLQSPEASSLNAVWGADRDHVVAVGNDDVSYVYEGGTWTRLGGTQPGHDYFGVFGLSASDVFAVGANRNGGGFVEHYDGTGWNEVYTTPKGLYGVWVSPDKFVLAVGAGGGLYGWHAGDTWHSFSSLAANTDVPVGPDDPFLWAISGNTFDDFSIAAGKDRIFHTEGQRFTYYDPVDTTISFRSVFQIPGPKPSVFFGTSSWGIAWLTAPGTAVDGAALADSGTAEMVQILADQATPGAADKYIQGIWGTVAKIVSVGDGGRIYTFDLGSDTVTRVASPTNAPLGGVWGSSLDDVWIVGDRELVMHGSLAAP